MIEIRASIAKSPYLNQRISTAQIDRLADILAMMADLPPKLADTFPQYTADADDDYLVAYAVVNDVDYLVTGDRHMLVLGKVQNTSIVLRATFLEILG